MTGFLGKLFGKKSPETSTGPEGLIREVLTDLISVAGLDFEFDIRRDSERPELVLVEVSGNDEDLLRAKEGQLLDAFQLYLTRVVQHQLKDERVNIQVDNSGFREQANQELIDLAEKLKSVALEKGKPVYFRALPPRERKVVHQYLADDTRVKSRSVGDGLFKKIKIFPVKGSSAQEETAEQPEA